MTTTATTSDTPRIFDQLFQPLNMESVSKKFEAATPGYSVASPFPHCVIDDVLPPEILRRAVQSFPSLTDIEWEKRDQAQEKKMAFFQVEYLPPDLRDIISFLTSAPMLRHLEKLTGIQSLLPDPHFYGGGIHQIAPGGLLEVHADFNLLLDMYLHRRLNLILFLNEDWEESYGGHLELWDTQMTECRKKVLPIFNRCVVFNTTSNSYHGHPEPLTCPEGRFRRSIALYYYTVLSPEEKLEIKWHTTLFQKRPKQAPERPLKRAIKRLTPPIVLDGWRAMKKRR